MDSDNDLEEIDNKISQLSNIISVSSEIAAYLLAQTSGDLNQAIAMHFSEQEVEGSFLSYMKKQNQDEGVNKPGKGHAVVEAHIHGTEPELKQAPNSVIVTEQAQNIENTIGELHRSTSTSSPNPRKRKLKQTGKSPQSRITSFFSSPKHKRLSKQVLTEPEEEISQPSPKQSPPEQVGSEADAIKLVKLPWETFVPEATQVLRLEGQCSCAFLFLASILQFVSEDSKRLAKELILCNYFRALLKYSPDDIYPSVCLASNHLPKKAGSEGGLGGSTISRAISEATGASREKLRSLYKDAGDLGDVAQQLKSNQKLLLQPRPLSIKAVFEEVVAINQETGQGCEDRKRKRISKILRSCREVEPRFFVRMLLQHVRTGATLTSVLAALAMAIVVQASPNTSAENMKKKVQRGQSLVKECFNQFSNLETVVLSLVNGGLELLQQECQIKVRTPVKPMLAKACNGVEALLDKMKGRPFSCEYKYDGQRCQIHVWAGGAELYSRHLDVMTEKYPDAIEAFRSAIFKSKTTSCVVDAELVAVDPKDNFKILPFQTLSTRSRKATNAKDVTVNVCVYLFDLIFLNGEPLTGKPLYERRNCLYKAVEEILGLVTFSRQIETTNPVEIEAFMNESIADNCEGIMAKLTHEGSEYIPSKRTDAWVKMKKDYVDSMSDSFDLVPIGAWWGNGRKAGWFSPFLLACYNPDTESFQTLCRCMSGFTDEFYKTMTEFYRKRLLDSCPPYVESLEQPSVWFQPCQVWEVRGAELTISPVHQAAVGIVHEDKGMSLRFPRFVNIRNDKSIHDATSTFEIAERYRMERK